VSGVRRRCCYNTIRWKKDHHVRVLLRQECRSNQSATTGRCNGQIFSGSVLVLDDNVAIDQMQSKK